MTLQAASLDWSIDFVAAHSDGDLFPKLPEMEAIIAKKTDFIAEIQGKPLKDFPSGACRRFIVMCQHFSGHTVKPLYAAIHNPRATYSHWPNVIARGCKRPQYIQISPV